MSIYKRGDTWYIYLVHHGERIRKSAETIDKAEAQRKHDELKAELWKRPRLSGKTWHDAVAAWLKAAPRDDADKYRLASLDYQNRSLSDVTADSILETLAGKSAATHNRYINVIGAILRMAQRRGWIPAVPHIDRRKQPPATFRWLTRAEWAKLDKELPDHLTGPARFAVYTGLRQANVTFLRWDQVNLQQRLITIHPEEMKGRKVLTVPLSTDAVKVLRAQLGRHAEWVFPYRDQPIAKIKGAWGKACKRADVVCRFHDLRHTWASWHVQSGTPLPVLQQLGGWASYQMVLKYAHLAPEHLRQWANNATVSRHKAAKK